MDEQQRKSMLKSTFDTVAEGYDNKALRFFPEAARHLADALALQGDEQVLDVATGTGHAAFALAARLPRGKVTATDFSRGMLAQASRKAADLKVRNVDFLERDMQKLDLPGGMFDAAVCSFGIFFVEDMEGQLAHIGAMVRPGGQVAITSFQESYFGPLKDLMVQRLIGCGVAMPAPTWKRVANKAGCQALFAAAGMKDARVERKNVGYYLESADAWWDVVWNAGFRRLVGQLSPSDQEAFKVEHLREVAALATEKGIWLDVGILITVGVKA